jgi:hypothetical protein
MTDVPPNAAVGQAGIKGLLPTRPANDGAPARADTLAFRRLLESLEQVGRRSEPAPESVDAASLPDVLQRAEEDFAVAMDLRRRLEQAFRARTP